MPNRPARLQLSPIVRTSRTQRMSFVATRRSPLCSAPPVRQIDVWLCLLQFYESDRWRHPGSKDKRFPLFARNRFASRPRYVGQDGYLFRDTIPRTALRQGRCDRSEIVSQTAKAAAPHDFMGFPSVMTRSRRHARNLSGARRQRVPLWPARLVKKRDLPARRGDRGADSNRKSQVVRKRSSISAKPTHYRLPSACTPHAPTHPGGEAGEVVERRPPDDLLRLERRYLVLPPAQS